MTTLIPTILVSKKHEHDLLEWYDDCENRLYEFKNIEVQSDNLTYLNFCEFIENILSSDCWAVKVNDEILFNYFNEREKKYKNKILDDVIRQELIDDIHSSLFIQLYKKNKDADIFIYMFGTDTWAYKISFCAKSLCFTISIL